MNRQTARLAQQESMPKKRNTLLQHTAVRPVAEHPSVSNGLAASLARDFTQVPVQPQAQTAGRNTARSCPMSPQRCPFGGACHSCPPHIQAKLKIGQPGDKYEQEADQVAEQVMRMPEPQVQRKGCSSCKDDEDKILQTKSVGSAGGTQAVDHPAIQNVLSSPGQPLDAGTRSFMEPRFGQDFSGVRVHVGGQAAESARAYTVGRDVVFGEGQYAPGSDEGKRLVAHELVHVRQQIQPDNAGLIATQVREKCNPVKFNPLKTEAYYLQRFPANEDEANPIMALDPSGTNGETCGVWDMESETCYEEPCSLAPLPEAENSAQPNPSLPQPPPGVRIRRRPTPPPQSSSTSPQPIDLDPCLRGPCIWADTRSPEESAFSTGVGRRFEQFRRERPFADWIETNAFWAAERRYRQQWEAYRRYLQSQESEQPDIVFPSGPIPVSGPEDFQSSAHAARDIFRGIGGYGWTTIYLRVNQRTGDIYVGRAHGGSGAGGMERLVWRQVEHSLRTGSPQSLYVLGYARSERERAAEEYFIRLLGGPARYGGTVQNWRYEMNETDFRRLSGQSGWQYIPRPVTPPSQRPPSLPSHRAIQQRLHMQRQRNRRR